MNEQLVEERLEEVTIVLDASPEWRFGFVPDDVSDLEALNSDFSTPEIWLG